MAPLIPNTTTDARLTPAIQTDRRPSGEVLGAGRSVALGRGQPGSRGGVEDLGAGQGSGEAAACASPEIRNQCRSRGISNQIAAGGSKQVSRAGYWAGGEDRQTESALSQVGDKRGGGHARREHQAQQQHGKGGHRERHRREIKRNGNVGADGYQRACGQHNAGRAQPCRSNGGGRTGGIQMG